MDFHYFMDEIVKSRLTMTLITMAANFLAAKSGLQASELYPVLMSMTTAGVSYIAAKTHSDKHEVPLKIAMLTPSPAPEEKAAA